MSSEKPVIPKVRKKSKAQQPRNTAKSLTILGCLLAGVFLLIFQGMSWLATENLDAQELYARTLDGRKESRTLAAVEWARQLNTLSSQGRTVDELRPGILETQNLCSQLESLLEDKANLMHKMEAYHGALAAVLSFSQVPPLANTCIENALISGKASEQLVIQGQLALARLAEPPGKAWMAWAEKALEDPSPSVRKVTAFSLGRRVDAPALAADMKLKMRPLLFDSAMDVRWSAAAALGGWGFVDGQPVYSEVISWAQELDSNGLYQGESASMPSQLSPQYLPLLRQVFSLVVELELESLIELIQEISKTHPHVQVRLAAIDVLEEH